MTSLSLHYSPEGIVALLAGMPALRRLSLRWIPTPKWSELVAAPAAWHARLLERVIAGTQQQDLHILYSNKNAQAVWHALAASLTNLRRLVLPPLGNNDRAFAELRALFPGCLVLDQDRGESAIGWV